MRFADGLDERGQDGRIFRKGFFPHHGFTTVWHDDGRNEAKFRVKSVGGNSRSRDEGDGWARKEGTPGRITDDLNLEAILAKADEPQMFMVVLLLCLCRVREDTKTSQGCRACRSSPSSGFVETLSTMSPNR